MKKKAITLILSGAMLLQVSMPTLVFASEHSKYAVSIETSSQINDIVNIPDPILKKALNKTIDSNRAANTEITKGELESLKSFNIQVLPHYERIKLVNLQWLQYATNLEKLVLDPQYRPGGNLSNLSQLENLTKLKELYLGGLNITDLSPLKNLKDLEIIELQYNYNLSDISPLKDLKKLKDIRMERTEAINSEEQLKIREEILNNASKN